MVGPRVELRPLKASDWAEWRDVRVRSRDWLEPWEPFGEPGAADPIAEAEAFKARCGAWERQRHFDELARCDRPTDSETGHPVQFGYTIQRNDVRSLDVIFGEFVC